MEERDRPEDRPRGVSEKKHCIKEKPKVARPKAPEHENKALRTLLSRLCQKEKLRQSKGCGR